MPKQKPVHEIRLGTIKAAIWANKTEEQHVRYNVTVRRLYKDGQTWKTSQSFGRDELPLVIKVLDRAYTWILENAHAKPDGGAVS